MAALIGAVVRDHGAAVALVTPGRPDLSYAQLGHQIEKIVYGLSGAGFGRTTRIAVAMPDGPEFATAILGVCSAATCAPLNDRLDEEALVRLLVAMRIDAVLVPEGSESTAVRAARRVAIALLALRSSPRERPGTVDLIAGSRRAPAAAEPPLANDIALLMHTSGTTGAPKIVPLEQWRVAETARHRVGLWRIDRSDRCLVALPLHSSAGIRRALAGLSTGGSIICPGALTGDATIDLLESLAPTQCVAAPASYIALLEALQRRVPRPRHHLKVIWSGTTEMSDAVQARLEREFSVPVILGYGMTESGSIAQTPFPPARAPAGSVGRATNIDIAIADDAGRLLGPGEQGEIVVKGPEVFEGYENDGEASRAAFRDGWFRTGDTGRIDRDGFLYLSGRRSDIVNRGGVKIAPGEIEAVLARHPQVIEAAAFAVVHPTLGQDVAAAVVLRQRVSESELRSFLRGHLPVFKIPARIVEMTELPRGPTGKLARAELALVVAGTARAEYDPPVGREETEIARIFSEVLQVPGLGRRDNFFDFGGDSLNSMRALAAVESALGVSVAPEVLFDHPTVAEFTAAIVAARSERTAADRPPALRKIERHT
ncbi:MAG: non-ribosomal peptide synthetase [Casimicrobiaceae bacterium]